MDEHRHTTCGHYFSVCMRVLVYVGVFSPHNLHSPIFCVTDIDLESTLNYVRAIKQWFYVRSPLDTGIFLTKFGTRCRDPNYPTTAFANSLMKLSEIF